MRYRPWEFSSWRWVDRETLLLDDLEGGRLVSTISGSADEVAHPGNTSFYWAVDPRGKVVGSAGSRATPSSGRPTTTARSLCTSPTGRT